MTTPSTTKQHEINVTQAHIDNGLPGEPSACAVALAIKQATGKEYVEVYPNSVYFGQLPALTGAGHYLPREVGDFIRDYDEEDDPNHTLVQPFSFILEY